MICPCCRCLQMYNLHVMQNPRHSPPEITDQTWGHGWKQASSPATQTTPRPLATSESSPSTGISSSSSSSKHRGGRNRHAHVGCTRRGSCVLSLYKNVHTVCSVHMPRCRLGRPSKPNPSSIYITLKIVCLFAARLFSIRRLGTSHCPACQVPSSKPTIRFRHNPTFAYAKSNNLHPLGLALV